MRPLGTTEALGGPPLYFGGSHPPRLHEVPVQNRQLPPNRRPAARPTSLAIATALAAYTLLATSAASAAAQTRAAPVFDPAATAAGPRPVPGPVYESYAFSRAVARGTRTRTGLPGANYWVQHPRYSIDATLDPARNRVTGHETVTYVNHSPDSLRTIAVYLRQNVFAPGVPRRQPAPITGGVTLGRVTVNGRTIAAEPQRNPAMPITAPPEQPPHAGQYAVDGTVMWIPLAQPLLPGDSVQLAFAWSYHPAPSPADGREGHDGPVYFMGYWYPEIAVYDDVDGWVTDPYQLEAEFYMDPADYDVRVTVPHGWVVDGTGTLANAGAVLTRRRATVWPPRAARAAWCACSRPARALPRCSRPAAPRRPGISWPPTCATFRGAPATSTRGTPRAPSWAAGATRWPSTASSG